MVTYDGPNSGSDYPHALALEPDGDRIFVSGLSAMSGDGPVGTALAYSVADGIVAWQSPSGGGEVVAGSDRVYVGGSSVVAFDVTTGVKAWEATDIQGSKLELDGSETQLFVLSSPAPTSNPLLMALDAGTGTVRWVRHLGSRNLIPGWDIAVAPSGEIVYVTGGSNRGGVSGITTSAYNAGDGSRLWSTFDRASSDADYGNGLTVAVSPDGRRVFAAGLKAQAFTTIGYEARSGKLLWIDRLHRPDWYTAAAMYVVANEDYVFATGVKDIDGLFGVVTVSYDMATGDRLWTRVINRCRAPTPLATSIDGGSVLVGAECGSRMTTISYRARDGVLQWSRTVQGGLDSSGTDLAVGDDGTIFAIGRLNQGSVGHANFLTIAYRP